MKNKVKVRTAKSDRTIQQIEGAIEELQIEGIGHMALLKESQSSVEITQDTKGAVKFTIKCYADTVDEAAANALIVYNDLKKKLGI